MDTSTSTPSAQATAHTAGPWEADLLNLTIEAEGKILARIEDVDVKKTGDITSANARLIAAAPELLELVKGFSSACTERMEAIKDDAMAVCECEDQDDHERHCDKGQQLAHWSAYKNEIDSIIAKAQA